ncbi:MAG TPA: hypothetical protein VFK76_09760 [Gaiellaceae bacterium]|nr:hypothetical protein [Gaiellaceae bacterium]
MTTGREAVPGQTSEGMPAGPQLPAGLTERNLVLGRDWRRRLVRYLLLGVLAAVILAAVADGTGQRPSTTVGESDAARLSVYSPNRVRGGLLFTTRFEIRARRPLRDATLVLDPGWFEGMQVNSIVPQPRSESSNEGRVTLDLGPVAAGNHVVTFVQFQVNPTNVGRRSQDVRLYDGSRQLVLIRRTVTVFP